MRFSIKILLIILVSLFYVYTQAQGLLFKGNEYIIDERTSFDVFHNLKPIFKDSLIIRFDLLAESKPNTGYILRLKTQDPSLIFNLSYNSQGEYITYNLNEEGKSTLLSITINKIDLHLTAWHSVKVKLDMSNQKVSFNIDNISKSCSILLPTTLEPKIHFGRSEYFIDLPTFTIRNLHLKDKAQDFHFPFNEYKGNEVHDQHGKQIGYVSNPTWLINKNYYWQHQASFQTKHTAGFNFDSSRRKIYYFDKDSIRSYDLASKVTQVNAYTNTPPIHLILGYNFLDIQKGDLYAYEITPIVDKEASLAKYSIENNSWTAVSNYAFPKRLHHHAKYFDEANQRFIIFGGFGDMYYNNEFNCYNLITNTWDKLKFTGDTISPRYFLSMGYNKAKNILYIFGGMGNESGEYNVGRKYYYDFYKVDLTAMHITKLWEIPWKYDYIVPVKSMIVEDDHFTTLCYPEHFSNTHLKLYKFSINDGTYQILGDSIPIRSEKITTNSDIFSSDEMGEIYGIVQEFENDDIASSLNIYSLATPVLSHEELFVSEKAESDSSLLLWITVASALVILLVASRSYKRSEKIATSKKSTITTATEIVTQLKKNAIFLFGDFAIYDRTGKDITYMFSTRLKQAFLIILHNSSNDGITTQQLTQALWWDRDDSKAKNIRGVTINDLRKILEELDGISLVYENSHYKILP